MKRGLIVVVLMLVAAWALFLRDEEHRAPGAPIARLDVGALLSGSVDGFETVTDPREFEFPADHGAHPKYRIEWWYFTGHLRSAAGHRLGFQLTFFRFALNVASPGEAVSMSGLTASGSSETASNWSAKNVYMAHFAVTDITRGVFHSFERLSREAVGLAGTTTVPFQVWTEDWSATSATDEFLPLHLEASEGSVSLSLSVQSGKPFVAQGNNGYSQKSDAAGNASHYYSYTRLPANGHVSLDDESFAVSGDVWLDREWSTSALAVGQVGWDWFAIQLDDGREIMFYQLRTDDGEIDPHSAGVLVRGDGTSLILGSTDVFTEALEHWSPPDARGRYPVRWRMDIERLGLSVEISAALHEQEHTHSVRYWEGAADVHGLEAGEEITGKAYIEMTGYADER